MPRARRAFEEFDTNRDNQLDARELRHALRHYGIDVTSRQAARVLDAYDDRPDRRMDLTEFSNLVQDLEVGPNRSARLTRRASPTAPHQARPACVLCAARTHS